eukprot:TRINITY_DN29132_c0_g1_i1.p1 TRINITY_DN29132_c0_g1~~TRINITY_DN29132_c0_g1_i1.p1  ORF type:complete len:699 (+),score=92.16 TRINITY_DN29132_c0_g1_i1:149-2245(+)
MAKKGDIKDDVTDFASMFTWIAGLGIIGCGTATVATLAVLPRVIPNKEQRKLGLLAVGAAALPAVSSVFGLLMVYMGFEFAQPSWGWAPPQRRSRNLGKARYSEKAEQQAAESKAWDMIVIGSGMGGLTCASMLAQFGYKVLVLEAHEVAGGSTHDYNVDGKTDYKFPSGLHYTIPASEEMLQAACGARRPPVKFARMGDDTVLCDGAYDRVRLTKTNDPELRVITDVDFKLEMRKRFPGLLTQIERFETVGTQVLATFPLWSALHALPWHLRKSMMNASLPKAWWQYAGRSSEDVLMELFADAPESEKENVIKLCGYICGLWLDSGCPPHRVSFFMIVAVCLGFPHEGGAYPEKGTGEMAAALIQRLESAGGTCFVRAPVAKIVTDEKGRAIGVKMTTEVGGGSISAKHGVVSACGYRNTARLCSAFPAAEELATPQGEGFVMANIGIRGSAKELQLECTNMELLPCGNGMTVFDGIRAYLDDPIGVPPDGIPLMITFPSVKDRANEKARHATEGHETAQILCLAKTEWFGEIEEPREGTAAVPAWSHPIRSPQYGDLKAKWEERLRAVFLSIYPQLKDRIELFDISTPLSIEHYLPTGSGSAIGLDTNAGTGCRFTDLEVMKKLDMKTPVPGLWMTGQDTLMCGVPLAQAAGLITAIRIAGPVAGARFVLKTVWLLVASVGEKARAAKVSRCQLKA